MVRWKPPNDEYVRKCGLNKALKIPELHERIEERVLQLSKISHRLSLFFNLHTLRLLEEGLPLPKFTGQNRTLYRQCALAGINIIKSKKANPEIEKSWILYKHYFIEVLRLEGDSEVVDHFAGKYQTIFLNHLKSHFFSEQFKMILLFCNNNKKLARKIQSIINNRSDEDTMFTQEIKDFIRNQKALLQTTDPIYNSWIENNSHVALRYLYFIQRCFEEWGKPNFPIAPIVTIKTHFLVIKTRTLYFLTKGFHQETNEKAFEARENYYWHRFFNINRYGKRYRFSQYIETDGVSLCIHFKRSRLPPSPRVIIASTETTLPPSTVLSPERTIAFDPGRATLLEGVEKLPDGSTKRYRLTKKQYYQESHITKATRKTKDWNREIKYELDALSRTTYRTPVIAKFLAYVLAIKEHGKVLWEHLTHKKYAQNRMDVYIHKNKCVDRFFNSLRTPDQEGLPKLAEPKIAFGSAKFAPTGPGEVPAPTTFISKRCCQYYETTMIDEYNTTKMCCECGEPLRKLFRKKKKDLGETEESLGLTKRNGQEIRGLRWCDSTRCCRKFRSRDVNAALNILMIATTETRPPQLCR